MSIFTRLVSWLRPASTPPQRYFNEYRQTDRGTIRVDHNCFPIAKDPVPFQPAVSAGLRHGQNPTAIDVSGYAYLSAGAFSPVPVAGAKQVARDTILGVVVKYDADAKRLPVQSQTVSLGKYCYLDRAEHVRNTIEIVPSAKPGRLEVIEARMETTGLIDDRSVMIYTLTKAGSDRLRARVSDLSLIRPENGGRVVINSAREVVVQYTRADGIRAECIIPGRYFVDNFGRPLLANPRAKMATFADFYQSDFYTEETKRFQPVIDEFPARNGTPRLLLHKTTRTEIERPAGLDLSGRVKIFPTLATAAAEIDGQWRPITLDAKLTRQDQKLISLELSRVQAGRKMSAIGAQERTGNMGEMSGEYARDANFYGYDVFKEIKHIIEYGRNVAINKGKSVSDEGGIESGRTHTMPYILLFDTMLADLIETNNPFVRKHSNYGHHSGGPGVSEDTQMELVTRLFGIRMWVVNESLARLPAEKRWGKYNIQNAVRYIFSESLFKLPMRFVMRDILCGRFFGTQPIYMKWGKMFQITAGATWYKWVLAKLIEIMAVPIFLATFGLVLFFPVDLNYFLIAWLGRNGISPVNYALQLGSLGYDGVRCGLWDNPAYERTFMVGYLRSAIRQWLDENQWATFALTVGGADTPPPAKNKWLVRASALIDGITLTSAGVFIALGGLSMLAWPLGLAIIANMVFGAYDLAINLNSLRIMKRESQPDAKQFTLEEFKQQRPDDYQTVRSMAEATWQQGLTGLQGRGRPDYDTLFQQLDEGRRLLSNLGAYDKKGRVSIGWSNRYRDIANQILDLTTGIEMMICLTSLKELETDINNLEARAALTKVLRETKEFVIMDTAIKAVRMHGWKLKL
jgi:hypothetical protein